MISVFFDILELNLGITVVIVILGMFSGKLRGRYGANCLKWIWLLLAVRLLIPYNFSLPTAQLRLFSTPAYERDADTVSRVPQVNAAQENGDRDAVQQKPMGTEATKPVTTKADPGVNGQDEIVVTTPSVGSEEQIDQIAAKPSVETEDLTKPAASDEQAALDMEESRPGQPENAEVTNKPISYSALFASLWLTGFCALVLYHVVCYLLFSMDCRSHLQAVSNEGIRKQIDSLQRKLIGRVLPVYAGSRVTSPMLVGVLRPKIIVPLSIGQWNEQELELIVAHELTHYRNRDLFLKLILTVSVCVNWINPAVHWMRRQCFYEMELACDGKVLATRSGTERERYARLMLSLAVSTSRSVSYATGFSSSKKRMRNRIEYVMNSGRKKRGTLLTALMLGIALLVTSFVSCGYKSEEAAEGPSSTVMNGENAEGSLDNDDSEQQEVSRSSEESSEMDDEKNLGQEEKPINISVDVEEHFLTSVGDAYNLYYIDDRHTLWGSGRNQYGQLGQGFCDDKFHTKAVKIAEQVVHVDYSQQGFAVFLTEDHKLYGFGNAGCGALQALSEFSREQYVNGREYSVSTPKLLLENVVYARCGRDDIAALDDKGNVWNWGTTCYLDMKHFYYVKDPRIVLTDAVFLTGGYYNHAALRRDGTVWTWGYNDTGNCGIENTEVVVLPTKAADHVTMVWTDQREDNPYCNDISLLREKYEAGPQNTLIEKEDGSKWICGSFVGSEEKSIPVYYGSSFRYSIPCTNEFLPYESYQPSDDGSDLPQGVVDARVKVYPKSYVDMRQEWSEGIDISENYLVFCYILIDNVTKNSFEFEIEELIYRTGETTTVVPKSVAYFIEDGKRAKWTDGERTLYFEFEDDQFEPILGFMRISGMDKLEGNLYKNNQIPGYEAG